jgi:hypothetical protein
MKKVLLFSLLVGAVAFAEPLKAQVNVQVNVGTQPQWGPAGYDYVDYYYLPDIELYYHVPTRRFIYLDAGQWAFSYNLPYRCRDYDLYSGYKIVLTGRDPYFNFHQHRRQYASYCRRGGQIVIRDCGNRGNYYRDDRRRYHHDDDYYQHRGTGNNGRGHGHDRRRW